MEYINDSSDWIADRTQSSKIKVIHENVKKVKSSEKMGVKYMQLWEEKAYIREDAFAEGIEKGLEAFVLDNLEEGKDRKIIIDKLKRRFQLSEKEAADCLEKYEKRQ